MGSQYNADINQNLLFHRGDWMFSYCVGGLLYRDGKILLQRTIGDDRYTIPEGHVIFGEFSQETLARRLMEATGAAIKVGRLVALVEIFRQWKKTSHQINLYYLAELKNKDALPICNFPALDELGQEQKTKEFCWIDANQLDKIMIYPSCLQPYLKQLPDHIIHLQENQMDW